MSVVPFGIPREVWPEDILGRSNLYLDHLGMGALFVQADSSRDTPQSRMVRARSKGVLINERQRGSSPEAASPLLLAERDGVANRVGITMRHA